MLSLTGRGMFVSGRLTGHKHRHSSCMEIQSKNEDDDETSQKLQGEQCSQQNGTLAAIKNAKRVSFALKKGPAHSQFVFASIPIERLDAGTYLLTAI